MPYYPGGEKQKYYYLPETGAERMVAEYIRMNVFEVDELPIDVYFFFLRDAFIFNKNQTEEGRTYLENCWRMEQTKPDRGNLREKFGKRN